MKEIKQFKDYLLHEKRYSENTVKAYLKDLELMQRYLSDVDLNLLDVDRDDIKDYLGFIYNDVSSTSLNRKLSAIRHFYQFLVKREVLDENPAISLSTPKKEKYLPALLTKDEVLKLIDYPFQRDEKGLRDKAIVELLYSSGIRVGELVSLKVLDADLKSLSIRVFGKGKKERIVPITSQAALSIDDYLFARKSGKVLTDNLFLNKKSHPITERGIQYILTELSKRAGIYRPLSPHMLRHSFASHFLENGMNLRYLQSMLGHSNLSTTEIYTHLSINEIKDVYKRAHPGNKK